jgi:hypothetical protein
MGDIIPRTKRKEMERLLNNQMKSPTVTGYGVAGQRPNYGYWVWKSGGLV